jgi:hypothetical protein
MEVIDDADTIVRRRVPPKRTETARARRGRPTGAVVLTHIWGWKRAVDRLLAGLAGRRAGRRVVAIAIAELVFDDSGVPSVVIEHGCATSFAALPGSVLRSFAAAFTQAANEQEGLVQ